MNKLFQFLIKHRSTGLICITISIRWITKDPIKIRLGWFPDVDFLYWLVVSLNRDLPPIRHVCHSYYPRIGIKGSSNWYWSGKELIFDPNPIPDDFDDIPF
jgi:hypothetical protein